MPTTVRTALVLLCLAAVWPAGAQPTRGGHTPPPKRESAPPPPRDIEPPKPDRTIEIAVTKTGFQPAAVTVKKGERIRLVVKRLTDETSAREFILDEFLVWQRLPLNQAVTETFITGRAGEFQFRSLDGKVTGQIKVEE